MHFIIIFFSIFALMVLLNVASEIFIMKNGFTKKNNLKILFASLIGSLVIGLYYYFAQSFEF